MRLSLVLHTYIHEAKSSVIPGSISVAALGFWWHQGEHQGEGAGGEGRGRAFAVSFDVIESEARVTAGVKG